jgi:formate dehydrogenase subunit gamma
MWRAKFPPVSERSRDIPVLGLLWALAVLMSALLLLHPGPGGSALAQHAPAAGQKTGDGRVDGRVPGSRLDNGFGADMWRSVREGIRGEVTIPDKKAAQLVQSEGDNWRNIRNGPLLRYGAYLLGGMVALLAVFYLWRGRIRIEHGRSGRTITRFGFLERFGHWLIAVSFVILAITGLNITFGRTVLLPVVGKEAFATLTLWGKYAHNYVAFAFDVGLVLVLVQWVAENIPNKYDWTWLSKGGGMFSKGQHPPARKFNAGQKILFWLVILGGFSLVLSGLDLLFPFEMALFSHTFAFLNIFGTSLPTDLAPIHEMQLATIWHAVVALIMIAAILGHIYIGTLGMEGAFDAMGTGEVDENWAREHHRIWVEEMGDMAQKRHGAKGAVPAE